MSPILVRPVREQLEHDRIIRLLQSKSKRRYEAGMNPGVEQNVGVGGASATALVYPDLVFHSLEKGKRLQAVVEVETGESVNHLEALAQWTHLARLRAAFHLYVPASMVDVARRLCEDNHIHVSEIWSYHAIGEDVRFTLVRRSHEAPPPSRARTASKPAARKKAAPSAKRPARSAARPARSKGSRKAVARQKRK